MRAESAGVTGDSSTATMRAASSTVVSTSPAACCSSSLPCSAASVVCGYRCAHDSVTPSASNVATAHWMSPCALVMPVQQSLPVPVYDERYVNVIRDQRNDTPVTVPAWRYRSCALFDRVIDYLPHRCTTCNRATAAIQHVASRPKCRLRDQGVTTQAGGLHTGLNTQRRAAAHRPPSGLKKAC